MLDRRQSTETNRIQSHDHPDRHLRHYAFELRIDPIGTDTERADATFRVTN
ncbi:AbfB domain-containing protein [Glycomyces arizonensis]|uniref:AbfB domain-containing protein n=1 Tax=Glycomyces arizonensis TaxID=256035 RepID=UPI00040E5B0D|nr:AbfB domain-containing protein [Glycomyces arizonensis]